MSPSHNFLVILAWLTITLSNFKRSAAVSNCHIKDYPYFVGVYEYLSGKIICGGSLFTPEMVLSGGRCCDLKPSDHVIITGMQMVGGKMDQNVSFDFAYKFHRNVQDLPPFNICILKLSAKLALTSKTTLLTIPEKPIIPEEVTLLGYTSGPPTNTQKLLCARMAVLPTQECMKKIPKIAKYGYCLKGLLEGPVCEGDEGSPVLAGSKQVCIFVKQKQFENQTSCGNDKVQICVRFQDDLSSFYIHRLNRNIHDHSGFLDVGPANQKADCVLSVFVAFVCILYQF